MNGNGRKERSLVAAQKLIERGQLDKAIGELAPTVTNILLFRVNLQRACVDADHLAEEIRITVLHETAHYFGLDEADLEALGLD